jgi:hypothetical protein
LISTIVSLILIFCYFWKVIRTQLFFKFYILLIIISISSCDSSDEVSAWDAVDNNSVLVFESREEPQASDKVFEFFFSKKSNTYLSSVQKSSKDDFGMLYSYLLPKENYDSILNSTSWLKNQKISSRMFNGIEIYEVKSGSNEVQFAFTYLSGIFALSKSSLLIENAIRIFQNQDTRSFKRINAELFQFPSLKSDKGNLYTNINSLSEVSVKESSFLKSIPLLRELKSLSVYDVKSIGDLLSLNGFSLGKNSSLTLFQRQNPIPFKVAKYIPNYASAFVHFGISDFQSFREVIDSSFLKSFNIGSEIAFVSTENRANSLVAFVEFNPGSSQDFNFTTDYSEVYSNYQIRSVKGDVLKEGLGKIFPEVPFSFCAVKDNYLFLTQSVEEMKFIIDAIENDDTWGKTLDYQKFSERGLQESNVTIIFKKPDLFAGYKSILMGYPDLIDSVRLSNLNWYSIQMSALDNHFYSNVNFSLGSSDQKVTESRQKTKSSFIEFPGTVELASLVKNHNTGLQEIIIQGSDLMIYLVSLKDGILWKKQMDGQIKGSLDQLDFYKNGKLQYFFATKNKLYIIDRLGRDVADFPKMLPSDVRFSGLIDYDRSKNYRFLISSQNNQVYLFDKKGNNLSEWGPKKIEKEIIRSPQHFKMGGKDYFIVFLADGAVQVFNRKGDLVNIFHTKEKKIFSGNFYLESGMSSSTTYLYYISKEGALVKQNMKGEILTTNNILRGKNSEFIMKRIVNSDKFYLYRVDADKIAVFNMEGTIIFEKQNSGSTNFDFQCIETVNNEVVFSFFDVEQKLAQVFDKSGNSLIQIPIESDVIPLFGFGKSKDEFGIFSFPRNSVVFNPIRR